MDHTHSIHKEAIADPVAVAPGAPADSPSRRSWRAALRALAKEAAFVAYLHCGCMQLRDWVQARLGRSRVVVLYYHRIGGCDELTRSVDLFRRDLDYLARRYECLRLHDLCERLRLGLPLRRPLAAVTFDDGYRDNYLQAMPVLLEAGVPATIFVSTGYVGTRRVFPHDARAAAGRPPGAVRDYPKLTWDDLRALQAAGFEIGSHTVEHTNLGRANDATLHRELADSLATLRRELGERPRAFAFPWGKPVDVSERAIEAVRQAGYYAAVNTYGGANRRDVDPFRICRLDAGNGHLSPAAVRARIAGFDPDAWRLRVRARGAGHRGGVRRHADC